MGRLILTAAVLALATASASAEARYDRSLEEAATTIVAEKMGEIRGSFDYDEVPEFVRPVDWRPGAWRGRTDPRPVASIAEMRLRSAHAF